MLGRMDIGRGLHTPLVHPPPPPQLNQTNFYINLYYFCDLFMNIVFGDLLTLFASSYDVLASNW